MNMKNNIESNVDYVVDVELLRIESLIEERDAYEEEFLSIAPPIEYDDVMFDYPNENWKE